MVKTQLLKGPHSFRGAGFVKIDDIYYPVCGSRKFELSEGAWCKWRTEQVQNVKPEETREGIIRAWMEFEEISGAERWRFYRYEGNSTPGIVIDNGADEEGMPSLLRDFGSEAHQMTAPFRIRYAGGVGIETAPTKFLGDTKAPFVSDINYGIATPFLTEIFIP